MEKISGIVKASPRLTSVDLKEASPVRPGTPGFGRPEGVSSLNAPPAIGMTAPKSAGIQVEHLDWRSKEAKNAAVAAEMSSRFFMKNTTQAEPVRTQADQVVFAPTLVVNSKPAGFKGDLSATRNGGPSVFVPMTEVDMEETMLQQPEGLYPKGSFIDRSA